MKIAAITWVRNEEDILECFLRHTASFADTIIVVLHRSRDASEEIIRRLHAEGLPISMSKDESPAHRQGAALTGLAHAMRDECPDWIVPLDADEFLRSATDIRDTIGALSTGRPSAIPWRTYVPTPADDLTEHNPVLRITHRRAAEAAQYRKVIIPGSLLDRGDLRIHQGSHGVSLGEEPQTPDIVDTLHIAHFPVRSEQQLRRKITEGWQSVLQNPDRIPGEEFHWEQLFARCNDPRPIGTEELRDIALFYAASPLQTADTVCDPVRLLNNYGVCPGGNGNRV